MEIFIYSQSFARNLLRGSQLRNIFTYLLLSEISDLGFEANLKAATTAIFISFFTKQTIVYV